jgi:hypothetical protein
MEPMRSLSIASRSGLMHKHSLGIRRRHAIATSQSLRACRSGLGAFATAGPAGALDAPRQGADIGSGSDDATASPAALSSAAMSQTEKVPYYMCSHTTPHTNFLINKSREAYSDRESYLSSAAMSQTEARCSRASSTRKL